MGILDGERYLRTAVESVLTRNFPDFEFLIVDDASADTTRQILDSFSDDRIQIVTNPHTLRPHPLAQRRAGRGSRRLRGTNGCR